MSNRSERIAANVEESTKTDFQIAAMRRDMNEAQLLRKLVQDFLDDEDIPDEVRQYFSEEGSLEGNGNPAMTAAN